MMKIWENNGMEEIGLVTPTPDMSGLFQILVPNGRQAIIRYIPK